jgi:predicted acylesterase/phospholipase RssA
MVYTHLVLSGGGIKGVYTVGALKCLEDEGKLKNIKYILGSSIGSIIGLLLTFLKIYDIISLIKIYANIDYSNIDIKLFIEKFGLLHNSQKTKPVEDILKVHFGKVPTLYELYKSTGIEYTVSVCNLSTMSLEYLNYKSAPDLSVLDAISFSTNIPLVFEKETYEKNVYVDPSIINNLSWEYYKDINHDRKIGIYLKQNKTNVLFDHTKLSEYISRIIKMILLHSDNLYDNLIKIDKENIVVCLSNEVDIIKLPENDIIKKMLLNGYETMQMFLKKTL